MKRFIFYLNTKKAVRYVAPDPDPPSEEIVSTAAGAPEEDQIPKAVDPSEELNIFQLYPITSASVLGLGAGGLAGFFLISPLGIPALLVIAIGCGIVAGGATAGALYFSGKRNALMPSPEARSLSGNPEESSHAYLSGPLELKSSLIASSGVLPEPAADTAAQPLDHQPAADVENNAAPPRFGRFRSDSEQ